MRQDLMKRVTAACTGAMMALGTAVYFGSHAQDTAAAADPNYGRLLQYSLYFYDCNMCGTNTDCAVTWRGACHTQDEVLGGYHDAGDHAMFGLPQGYTASTIGWAYYEFKDAFLASGQADHFKTVSKHFTEFFKASTKLSGDTVSSFLYQKGDGDVDHQYWGKPENQEQVQGKRKMFWTSNSASDIAADYAAALAFDYINFGDAESLKYAKALYNFSKQYNAIEKNGPLGFYLDKDHPEYASPKDEQAWAAGALYLATKDNTYKSDLEKGLPYPGWVHGWNTVDVGACCLYGEITGDWSRATGYMKEKIDESKSKGRYFFVDNGGKWGSARINCSMQLTALVATKHRAADYTDWAKDQMAYILGDNPAGTCFVTGFASNSAKNAHHRAASGYNNYDELGNNKTYSSNGHVLIGALVGGPGDRNGTYSDVIDDYKCNEVAIDYNAGLVGAAAALYSLTNSNGQPDTSIEGVGSVSISTQPTGSSSSSTTASTTSSHSSSTSTSTTVSTQQGGDSNAKITEKKNDEGNTYWQIDTTGASKLTVTLKSNSGDTEANGVFNPPGGWAPDDWKATVSNGKYTLEYTVPAGQSFVDLYVWWPTSSTIESAVLSGVKSSTASTTPSTTSSTSTSKTTSSTTASTTASTTSSSSTSSTSTSTKSTQPQTVHRGDLDCDGRVTVADAVLLARLIGNDSTINSDLTTQGKRNAECDGQDGFSSNDLTVLLKYLARVITEEVFKSY